METFKEETLWMTGIFTTDKGDKIDFSVFAIDSTKAIRLRFEWAGYQEHPQRMDGKWSGIPDLASHTYQQSMLAWAVVFFEEMAKSVVVDTQFVVA